MRQATPGEVSPLIGSIVVKICPNAADKLLTADPFPGTLALPISCIVARLFSIVVVKACFRSGNVE